ncbi:MAG: EamA family transporter RarD [Chloroflexi bacterium HGW-Chloroflexi-3]|nr:MAG: EamA family transporter RarD [Chloroflexi bacterium HGW-Chloroflexi-3]
MKKGLIFVFSAYTLWGFFPVYFKFLHEAPALQIMSHRVTWSFIFLIFLIALRKEFSQILKSLTKKILLTYTIAGTLLAINWLTYVWGVNAGFVVETSLGYFINPLVSVVLGVVFLKEKLRNLQWIPVVLATIGVIYLAIDHGSLPWIALVLASTFGTYGLIKKIAPLPSIHGLTIETGAVLIPAVLFLLFVEFNGTAAFGHASSQTTFLLVLSGIITAIPLIFFASGAPKVPLTTIGILQYIAPTIQFLIGVFIYDEPFTTGKLIGFSIVWIALIIFTVEGLMNGYRSNHVLKPVEVRVVDQN